MPQMASAVCEPKPNSVIMIWPAMPPAAAPTNIAGENIPPNMPNPIQSAVNANFNISKVIRNGKGVPPCRISSTVSVPSPSTSGTKMPAMPVTAAAVTTRRAKLQPLDAANCALRRIATMKSTATSPKTGPATSAAGSISPRLIDTSAKSNSWRAPKNCWLNHTDETLAIAMGPIARIEK